MSEQKPSIVSPAVKYGIIMAVISFIINIVFTYSIISGAVPVLFSSILILLVSIVIMIVFIIMAYKEFKRSNEGWMTFGQGIGIGVITCVISGLIATILAIAYFNLIDTEAQKQVADISIEATVSMMENNNVPLPPGFEEEQRAAQEKNQQPLYQLMYGVGGSLVLGFIFSLILGAIMKKTPSEE